MFILKFLSSPNLPINNVSLMLVSSLISETIKSELLKRKIQPICVTECNYIDKPVACHPDMLYFHLGDKNIVVYNQIQFSNMEMQRLISLGFNICLSEKLLSPDFPYDVLLNGCRIGDNLICKRNSIDPKIINYCLNNNIKIIDVKQGYSKCSICVVNETSLITADKSIYDNAIKNKLNCLLIHSGYIELKGYNEGFIGGCSGKSNNHTIMFTGNLKEHPSYNDIKSFLDNIHFDIDILSNDKLYDYGSLIPLMEYDSLF